MQESISAYLDTLAARRRSPHTLRAAGQNLTQFVTWWERREGRSFDPALLLDSDLRDWQQKRQRDDGVAPATINRALSTLRSYCAWAVKTGLVTENAAADIDDVPMPALSPRGLPKRSRRCCGRRAPRKMQRSGCAMRRRWRC